MGTVNDTWTRDYARVEKALQYIERNIERRPPLPEVARAAGLSEFHFQRLFSRMVGISPKRYEQFLGKEAARRLLEGQATVLDAAWDAGLSGPGRLHDLFVACEAVTPGEYKSRGRGLRIRYGFHHTPFGEALLALTERGLCALSFTPPAGRAAAVRELREEWHNAAVEEDPRAVRAAADAIFDAAPGARAPLPVYLRGTNFQIKVWEALLRIPPGAAATYEQVAQAAGSPGGARAAGAAVGRNPVAYVIPCHRVIRATGALGGYRWGLSRKRLMLAWEAERAAAG